MRKARATPILAYWTVVSLLLGGCIELHTRQEGAGGGGNGGGGAGGEGNGGGGNGGGGETADCQDKIKNGSETDTDCGGPDCSPCDIGKQCSIASDCVSGICSMGTCVAPSCSDLMRNGNETDVDCGGASCPPCAVGQGCKVDADCASSVCVTAQCEEPVIVVGATVVPAGAIFVTISPPGGTVMGDLLVLFVAHGGGASTVPTPMGWTEIENGSNPGQDPKLDVFYRQYDGSASYMFVKDGGGGSAILAAFRGAQYGVKGAAENDISVDLSTNDESTHVFVSLTNSDGDIPAKPVDFTELALGNTNGRSIRVSYSALNPAGMYTLTAVVGAGENIPDGTFAMSVH